MDSIWRHEIRFIRNFCEKTLKSMTLPVDCVILFDVNKKKHLSEL